MTKVKAEVQPDGITDDVGQGPMTFIFIHAGIVPQTKLIWHYPKKQCYAALNIATL